MRYDQVVCAVVWHEPKGFTSSHRTSWSLVWADARHSCIVKSKQALTSVHAQCHIMDIQALCRKHGPRLKVMRCPSQSTNDNNL
ncbi:hypothetical protein CY34DRAFT_805489 [Suillus luteus UH-Slu-Lm8-n1]|uniref:Uncharacterized protein n=1 Tax=Suillus luteus UH-Slu-Lm8-n1 TaxID=930992 RepID=A0A0D0AVL9_9AGAM|nr:hypothetical protein CY34DRAFT_805489 [Suillus luteus UH-Slu-Lm8-n1]